MQLTELLTGQPFVIVLLVVTVYGLWKAINFWLKAWVERENQRLDNCEELHKKAQEEIKEAQSEIKELYGNYEYLRGEMNGVKALSKSVLEAIKENNAKDS